MSLQQPDHEVESITAAQRVAQGHTNNRKGEAFEVRFARHMSEELGWKIQLRVALRGEVVVRTHDCDILGSKRRWAWFALWLAAIFAMLCLVLVVILLLCGGVSDTAVQPSEPWLGLLIVLFLVGLVGQSRHTTRVWVECKTRKARIKYKDIAYLVSRYDDVAKTRAKRLATRLRLEPPQWERWFVSTSRFDSDAIEVARDTGVKCFFVSDDDGDVVVERVDV